jgi:hypothetical protein
MNKIPHHTSIQRGTYYADWGTPGEVLDLVRYTFGCIDTDLCSSKQHNKIVGARKFYSRLKPCPEHPRDKGVIWCNPPGPSELVIEFWNRWCWCTEPCQGGEGAFLIFNLDHWRMLHIPNGEHFVWLPRNRLRFIGAPSQASFPSAVVFTRKPKISNGHLVAWNGVLL